MVVGLRRSIVFCCGVGIEMEKQRISEGEEGGLKWVELPGRPWHKLRLALGAAFSGRPR